MSKTILGWNGRSKTFTKYKIDWEATAREKQDEIDRLCKLIDRYALWVVGLIVVAVGMFILGMTIGRGV